MPAKSAAAGVLAGFLALPAPVQAWNTVVWGGSLYEYVETYMKRDDAKLSAASMSYLGYPGRLATITSAEEQAALALDLDPTEAVHLDVDFDSLSGQEGSGMALGTKLLAHFILGDIEYVISGEVQAGDKTILGTAFPYSVRAIQTAPVPEPANAFLFGAGVFLLFLIARRQAGNRTEARLDSAH